MSNTRKAKGPKPRPRAPGPETQAQAVEVARHVADTLVTAARTDAKTLELDLIQLIPPQAPVTLTRIILAELACRAAYADDQTGGAGT